MLRYPCRCRKCGARKTLAKHPDLYLLRRFAKCACGGDMYADHYRRKKEHKRTRCNCDGLSFPHRKACTVWCKNHLTGPTEADWERRYGQQ